FQGDTISPVGVRYKGSVGAFVGCLSGGNIFAPSGEKTCTKLSMKIQINWEGRDEKFFKQKKLQFHSMNLDPTQMHERLGYWLFRELGVPGPRSVHSRLLINDEYVGLFALTEQIDNRMIKYNFNDDDGNLYKEIWPLSMSGEPYSDQKYIDALKTNEDDNPSIDLIKNFGEEIKNASSTDINAIVKQYMNIDEIISYAVVDRTIRHDDGPFHWYCDGNDCSNHNYYWYEEPSKNELHLIPWDLGNAFENINNNANPVTLIADDWGETSNNCEPFPFGGFGIEQWSASCDKLIKSWSTNTELYDQKKQLLINGSMSVASTDQILTDWQNQIKAATVEASDMHNDALSLVQWEAAIMNLKEQLEFARNN
ncbi:CotH kinase family protein, partial [Saprospiraceae bacterium]|nr:CotH kinase family protein [Saprospiraceae bacterium]